MSHYVVAVISDGTKTVEELLAPYDENIEVEPYIDRTKDQMIEQAKKRAKELQEKIESGDYELANLKEWQEKYLAAKTDEDFYILERCSEYEYDEDGNELTTYNPNSKWDWYCIGGRFPGRLKAAKGEHGEGSAFHDNPCVDGEYDVARICDIDFSPNQQEYDEAARWWELFIEDATPLEGEEKPDPLRSKEYYLERYHNKETFAKARSLFSPYACITPDGEWHAPGEMGWFGLSTESHEDALDWDLHFVERFIDTADPNWTITMVDCHI